MMGPTETDGGGPLRSLHPDPILSIIRSIIKRHNHKTEAATVTPPSASSSPPDSSPQNLSPQASPMLSGQLEAQRVILNHQLYLTLISQQSPLAHLFSTLKDAQCTEQAILLHAIQKSLSTANPVFPTSSTSLQQPVGVQESLPHVHTSHSAMGAGEPTTTTSATTTISADTTTATTRDERARSSHDAAVVVHVHAPSQATRLTDRATSPSLPPLLSSSRRGEEETLNHLELGRHDNDMHTCGSTEHKESPLFNGSSSHPDYLLVLKAAAIILDSTKDPATGTSTLERYFNDARAAAKATSADISSPITSSPPSTDIANSSPCLAALQAGAQAATTLDARHAEATGAGSPDPTYVGEPSLGVDGPAEAADASAISSILPPPSWGSRRSRAWSTR